METMMSVARIKTNSMTATARGAPPQECANWKKVKVEIVPNIQINYETTHKYGPITWVVMSLPVGESYSMKYRANVPGNALSSYASLNFLLSSPVRTGSPL